tara:strand:+ start:1427 stop:2134 length:708 start_codon:yes stop_codon:yes gene_type:complete
MIDDIYKVLLTIINKENQGYISPTEYNLLANNVQSEIFRSYFEEENLDKNKENRGLTNRGYSNLSFNQRQRITPFAASTDIVGTVTGNKTVFNIPDDSYFIEDNGISTTGGKVLDEIQRHAIARLMGTEAAPTATFPVYEPVGQTLLVYPNSITGLNIRYIREPEAPKWTFFVLPNGSEMFDASNGSFQDFELHESEFSNIVLRMLSFFGINLREEAVIKVAEALKSKLNQKDNA